MKQYINEKSAILIGDTVDWELYYNKTESCYMLHDLMIDEYITIETVDDTEQVIQLVSIMEEHEREMQEQYEIEHPEEEE
tara:strand:+ start:652 stop:891 length:240 start_codon:yes stop_codon:yes gene_type:complete